MPTETYRRQGFTVVAAYPDPELRLAVEGMVKGDFEPERQEAVKGLDPNQASEVSVCVLRL